MIRADSTGAPSARILDAWAAILRDNAYVLGEHGEGFERELAAALAVDHAVGVSSGTDALALILRALEVEGREVIVPALSFVATAEAVIHAGGTPVFADVHPETWTLTAPSVAPHITKATAAIMPVHLFGNPAPVDRLSMFGIPVVEDACQALGSTYGDRPCGSLGVAAAFSFYPSKTIPGCGDGGAVTTNDSDLAERIRRLRHHGADEDGLHVEVGGTHRLDELQAAALRIRLEGLAGRVAAQRIRHLNLVKRGFDLQQETEGGSSAWHRNVSLFDERNVLPGQRVFYDPPLHLQPSMRPYWREQLPVAEDFARRNVCL